MSDAASCTWRNGDLVTSVWSEDEVGRVLGESDGMVLVAWPLPNGRVDVDEVDPADLTRVDAAS